MLDIELHSQRLDISAYAKLISLSINSSLALILSIYMQIPQGFFCPQIED